MKFQQHEFRVSSFVSLRRDFSIFRSFSLSRSSTAFSPQLLHLSFLFPSVTDPLLLSSIHSFLSLRATLHLFFLLLSWVHLDAFPLSLSVDPRSLPRWTRATQCLSAGRRGVATSRERVCVGRVVGTVGKFSCRRLCARRQWCSPPPSLRGILLDFLLSRSKNVSPRTQKKKGGAGRGGKRYIIRGVARKFNSIARRGSHLLPRESRTPVDAINAGASFRDEFKIDEIYRIEESNGFLCSFKFKLSNVKSFVPVISEQVEWISTRGEFVWEENGGRGSDASRFAIWRPCPGIWETRRRHRSPRLRGTERGGGAVGAHEARREG